MKTVEKVLNECGTTTVPTQLRDALKAAGVLGARVNHALASLITAAISDPQTGWATKALAITGAVKDARPSLERK